MPLTGERATPPSAQAKGGEAINAAQSENLQGVAARQVKPVIQPFPPTARQSFSHAGILTHADVLTGRKVVLPSTQSILKDDYPAEIFPNVTIGPYQNGSWPNKRPPLKRMLASCGLHSVIAEILSCEEGYIDYRAFAAKDQQKASALAGDFSKPLYANDALSKELFAASWYVADYGRRRVAQEVVGGILLANLGEDVGQPNLPAIREREHIPVRGDFQLYAITPNAPRLYGQPYVRVAHHEKNVTSFVGFMATSHNAAIRRSTNYQGEYDTTATSGFDLSLFNVADQSTEQFIGETIARTILLPDFLAKKQLMDTPSPVPDAGLGATG